jgi:hypothetical protein
MFHNRVRDALELHVYLLEDADRFTHDLDS